MTTSDLDGNPSLSESQLSARARGIEPLLAVLETAELPLHEAR